MAGSSIDRTILAALTIGMRLSPALGIIRIAPELARLLLTLTAVRLSRIKPFLKFDKLYIFEFVGGISAVLQQSFDFNNPGNQFSVEEILRQLPMRLVDSVAVVLPHETVGMNTEFLQNLNRISIMLLRLSYPDPNVHHIISANAVYLHLKSKNLEDMDTASMLRRQMSRTTITQSVCAELCVFESDTNKAMVRCGCTCSDCLSLVRLLPAETV